VTVLQTWFEHYRRVSAKWPRALRYLVAVPALGLGLIALPFFLLWRSALTLAVKVAGTAALLAVLGVLAFASGALDNPAPASPLRTSSPLAVRTAPPTTAATPAPPTSTPTPAPAPYTVVSRKDVSFGARKRTEVRAIVAGQLTREEKISTLAEIARRERRADVIVVFAFRSAAEERETAATVGRATVSTDGKGWTGDGQSVVGPRDTGIVQGDVVLDVVERVLAPTKQEPFTAPP
jgi:hypothetical protein